MTTILETSKKLYVPSYMVRFCSNKGNNFSTVGIFGCHQTPTLVRHGKDDDFISKGASPTSRGLLGENLTAQLLSPKFTSLYVASYMGGPGSGKGTQCANIAKYFGYTHLSAGDLLRAEKESGSQYGTMIKNIMKEGKIVPSEVTIKLLQRRMQETKNHTFLIDGFPRNEENRAAFESITGIEPEFVLFFDCPQDEMERRLLGRNQGREDDNIETIRKRFKVFLESSLPVIEYYNSKGKVRKIDGGKPVDEVFEAVKAVFTSMNDTVKHHNDASPNSNQCSRLKFKREGVWSCCLM